MDVKNLHRMLQNLQKGIEQEVNDRLPRKVGVMAKNHFRQNFRNAGFMDGGNHRSNTLKTLRNHNLNIISFCRDYIGIVWNNHTYMFAISTHMDDSGGWGTEKATCTAEIYNPTTTYDFLEPVFFRTCFFLEPAFWRRLNYQSYQSLNQSYQSLIPSYQLLSLTVGKKSLHY